MENIEEQKDIEILDTDTVENAAPPVMVEEGQEEAAIEQVEHEEKPQHSEAQKLRFDVLREARQKAERENAELKEQLERYKRQQTEQSFVKQPEPQTQEEDYHVAPDDLVEGKHLSKYDNEIKKLRSELSAYKQQTTEKAVESRVNSQYPDFNSVVTQENIEMLRTAYPEIASTLNSSNDLYSKAVSAYTMIKKLGIVESPIHEKRRNIAQKNSSSPRPIAAINAQPGGDSPLSKANAFSQGILSKEEKDALYREILESKRNR